MKKNKMLRIASVLLVAVMMSTCAISGTFAKYVTSDTGSDSAQVAKFGVKVTIAEDLDLFDATYAKKDGTTYNESENTVEAVSGTTYKLVAPGTQNLNAATIKITGTPEVAVNVETVAVITLTGWEIDSGEYCPLVFTVDGTDYSINENETVAAFASRVAALISVDEDYEPNTDLASTNDHTLGWRWDFEGAKDDQTGEFTGYQTDVKDTKLGDKAVNNAPTIYVSFTTTVTQID